jgi:hypothetical protein
MVLYAKSMVSGDWIQKIEGIAEWLTHFQIFKSSNHRILFIPGVYARSHKIH